VLAAIIESGVTRVEWLSCERLQRSATRIQYSPSQAFTIGTVTLPLSGPNNQTTKQPPETPMNMVKAVGILLIVAGVLGVVFSSFSFTKQTHEAKLGPIELSLKEKQTVNIPVWASVAAIVVGGVLLVVGGRKG
jgi:NADH:ubiquinone oxidoreductase subunit 5 (subunit L)/multisubunit Na+/H+ antiporter MnhA subunit